MQGLPEVWHEEVQLNTHIDVASLYTVYASDINVQLAVAYHSHFTWVWEYNKEETEEKKKDLGPGGLASLEPDVDGQEVHRLLWPGE